MVIKKSFERTGKTQPLRICYCKTCWRNKYTASVSVLKIFPQSHRSHDIIQSHVDRYLFGICMPGIYQRKQSEGCQHFLLHSPASTGNSSLGISWSCVARQIENHYSIWFHHLSLPIHSEDSFSQILHFLKKKVIKKLLTEIEVWIRLNNWTYLLCW